MGRKNIKSRSQGFTLIELVIVIAILAVLIILATLVLNPITQISKARDAKRKSDLKKISTVLEDYYNDKGCYPKVLTALVPSYLSIIPNDPKTGQFYTYYIPEDSDCGGGSGYSKFALFTDLETEVIYDRDEGNFVVTSPNYRIEAIVPTSAPTSPPGVPTGSTNYYGCFSGACAPIMMNCSLEECCQPNFVNLPNCDPAGFNRCSDPRNACE